jgi:uncharacterized protein
MRSYNDPVHGKQVLLGPVAAALFQHPALLQLRGKRQLGLAHFIFSNATHTRYLHSVGTLIAAQRLSEHLRLSDEEARLLQAAAALHDIGHYPVSHCTEAVRGLHHEEIPQLVLNGEDFGAIQAAPLLETLKDLGVDPLEVAAVLAGEHRLSPLISHPVVDVDRLDYLPRDFFACGVSFGADADRILSTLTFDDGVLGVRASGVVSLTSFMVARALAYDQVYMHSRAEIAETMLKEAIRQDPALSSKDRATDERVHAMSDEELFSRLEQSEDERCADLARRLRQPISQWYHPLLVLGGEGHLSEVLELYDRRSEVEERLRKHGFLWSWNLTGKLSKRATSPRFPVSDGTDLFDRPLPKAAHSYVPERLLCVYGPKGSFEEKTLAKDLLS